MRQPANPIDVQVTYDEPNGYRYACYDCSIVGTDGGTYGSGSLYMNNELEVMSHIKEHVRRGDQVRNETIAAFTKFFRRDCHVHQSLCNPNRRTDAHVQGRREKAFFEQWLLQQDNNHLALNLLDSWGVQDETQREVRIMASVIQWLGSNVGFSFLEATLHRAGYQVVRLNREAFIDEPIGRD